jgi:putative aldouronate transport system substrate-binding protein
MLKKMKLSAIVCCILMTISLLSGCTQKKPTEAGTKKDALEPVELSWYLFQNDPGPGLKDVEAEVNAYLKDKINATIKIYPLGWDEFKNKTTAMSAAQESYDITFSPGWIGFNEYQSKNMYVDITDMLDKYAPETMKLFKSNPLYMQLFNGCTVDGKIYGIPTLKEVGHRNGILLNKKYVDKYNMDITKIKTAKDIEPLLQIIKDNEPEVIPSLSRPERWVDSYSALADDVIPIRAAGKSTKLSLRCDMPEFEEAFKMAVEWYKKGFLPKDAPTMNVSTQEALKKEGKVFVVDANVLPGMDKQSSNDKVTWVQVATEQAKLSNKDLGGSQNSISSTSKNPERALMFLNLVNTDKTLNNILAFGVEGKHYTKVSENVIKPIENSGYSHGWQWAYGNQLINFLKADESPNKWKDIEEFNKSCIADPNVGFNFKLDNYQQIVAATKAVNDTSYIGWGVGEVEKELDKLRKGYTNAGTYKLLEDVQKAYDEWLKNKK